MNQLHPRTLIQRDAAIAKANRVRQMRADLKIRLRQGESAVPLLLNPEWWFATMKTYKFVAALPGFGPKRMEATLRRCGIGHTKTVAGLTDRQRNELAARLGAQEAARAARAGETPPDGPEALVAALAPSERLNGR